MSIMGTVSGAIETNAEYLGSLPSYTLQLLMEIRLGAMLDQIARLCKVRVVLAPFINVNQSDSEAVQFNHWPREWKSCDEVKRRTMVQGR